MRKFRGKKQFTWKLHLIVATNNSYFSFPTLITMIRSYARHNDLQYTLVILSVSNWMLTRTTTYGSADILRGKNNRLVDPYSAISTFFSMHLPKFWCEIVVSDVDIFNLYFRHSSIQCLVISKYLPVETNLCKYFISSANPYIVKYCIFNNQAKMRPYIQRNKFQIAAS